MPRLDSTEARLALVLAAIALGLSLASPQFLTLPNLANLLNGSAVNLIMAVGLIVVLVCGGIDISFAVAASVVQYVAFHLLQALGGGHWALGFVVAGALGMTLGLVNAGLIQLFGIISIVVTIATFNAYFGLLMFFTNGVSLFDLPPWWTDRIVLVEHEAAPGRWAELTLPVAVMAVAAAATALLLRATSLGRQLYAFGDNPEGARRVGISPAAMRCLAFGWCGMMAGIAGLMQVNVAQEIVPNALIGRELDVLAAVVLGGARLGGGRGTVAGCVLGVLFVAVIQNGLNLLGVSPYAFKMVVGGFILFAISMSRLSFGPQPAGRAP